MGMRTYEVVIERRVKVKAPNQKTVKEQHIDTGLVPVYEGENIVSIKEFLPKQELLETKSVYTPKSILRRHSKVEEPEYNPPMPKEAISDAGEPATAKEEDFHTNLVPFPTRKAEGE